MLIKLSTNNLHSDTVSVCVQTWQTSSSVEEKTVATLAHVLQTPATIILISSLSFCDSLPVVIICYPHEYDGLLKDPQDAA